MGPRAGLDGSGKSRHRDLISGPPDHREMLYRLSYPKCAGSDNKEMRNCIRNFEFKNTKFKYRLYCSFKSLSCAFSESSGEFVSVNSN